MEFNLGIFLGLIGIAIAIFFGVRGFNKDIRDRIENIIRSLVKIDTRLEDLINRNPSASSNTVVKELNNFGSTSISATPGNDGTEYTIKVNKGNLSDDLIIKLSKHSSLAPKEMEIFGVETELYTLGNKTLRVSIPSTDSKKCTQYISFLLKWLDTEYIELQRAELASFEEDIEV